MRRDCGDTMNENHPLDDCPEIPAPDLMPGSAGYVSNDASEAVPVLWIPDPERPSQYVEHRTGPERPAIGFLAADAARLNASQRLQAARTALERIDAALERLRASQRRIRRSDGR